MRAIASKKAHEELQVVWGEVYAPGVGAPPPGAVEAFAAISALPTISYSSSLLARTASRRARFAGRARCRPERRSGLRPRLRWNRIEMRSTSVREFLAAVLRLCRHAVLGEIVGSGNGQIALARRLRVWTVAANRN